MTPKRSGGGVADDGDDKNPRRQRDSEIAETTQGYLTLAEAAQVAPGRPSTNCVWRWCRRGVIARSGERIRLQHIRVGGKLFSTTEWVREFGRRLADADAAYFDRSDTAVNTKFQEDEIDRQLGDVGL